MFAILFQHVVNGVIAGALIAIPAIGLTLMFAVMRFPNFALGAHMTVGAYAAYLVNRHFHWGVLPMLLVAFAIAGVAGLASDALALKKLRGAKGTEAALVVAIISIALNIVLESLLRFAFGNDLYGYELPLARDFSFGDIHVGPQQLQNMLLSIVLMGAVFAFLVTTRVGQAMRAVADNPALAALKGIRAERFAMLATFLGMGLAGLGGVLLALDTSIDPLTGYRVLLTIFAATVVGGLGSVPGAVVGAIVIGLAEELALLAIPPTYRSAIGFAAILVVLSFRPQGLLGERT